MAPEHVSRIFDRQERYYWGILAAPNPGLRYAPYGLRALVPGNQGGLISPVPIRTLFTDARAEAYDCAQNLL